MRLGLAVVVSLIGLIAALLTTVEGDERYLTPTARCISKGWAAMFNEAGQLIGCRPLTYEDEP